MTARISRHCFSRRSTSTSASLELDRLGARPRRGFVGPEPERARLLARDREAHVDEPGQQRGAVVDRPALLAGLGRAAVAVLDDGRRP